MFYYVFIGAAILITTMTVFGTYSMTKEETENAITAKSIMNNVESIEKLKKTKEEFGVKLGSVYELELPISTFIVKDNVDGDSIKTLNSLQIKIRTFVKNNPKELITCDNLLSKSAITNEEFEKCNTMNGSTISWIEDNEQGLKYSLTDEAIAKKIGTNFGTVDTTNNKVYSEESYLFKNYSNQNVRNEKIKEMMDLLKKHKEKREYVKISKILTKINFFSQEKALFENELLLKHININNTLSEIEKDLILKNTLIISFSEAIKITKLKYPHTTYFLNTHKSKIAEIILKTNFKEKETIRLNFETYLKNNIVNSDDLNLTNEIL
jgi:hypothetical protein